MATNPPVTPVPVFNSAYHKGTAAELIHYTPYAKAGTSETSWTRWATASENFEVAEKDGKRYLIKFDKNFSKKHLVTVSKKELKTEAEAAKLDKALGKEANLKTAQLTLLNEKILKTLGIRAGTSDKVKCSVCSHPKKNDPVGTGHSKSGNCQVASCACTGYVSSYGPGRLAAGKSDENPLAGVPTSKMTCIVLNWVPLTEFQHVVGASMLNAEKAAALAVGTEVHLKWDFGTARAGAIRYAENGAMVDTPALTWCEVSAKKVDNDPTKFTATWQVFHWNGQD